MAADQLAAQGHSVRLFDAMPSVGRKFLLAGKGGLNLTHSEDFAAFSGRYGSRQPMVQPWLQTFGPDAVRLWAAQLGVETFVGTSGRVFPQSLKAAPLLRAWLHRLRHYPQPVEFHMRHRWVGFGDVAQGRQTVWFETPAGRVSAQADAILLALGGGSWPQLGSDGAWFPLLQAAGVQTSPLVSANCGFDVSGGWSPYFASRFAGQPFKSVAVVVPGINGVVPSGESGAGDARDARDVASWPDLFRRKGEFVVTATGIEGSLIYAAASLLRDHLDAHGTASFRLDLLPDMSLDIVLREVQHPRGSRSMASHLKSRLKIDGIKSAILHEFLSKEDFARPEALAAAIKGLPIRVSAARPIQEAISTGGGVHFDSLDNGLMLKPMTGVFCAGEMLDWEAPTGGYLLTACLASGRCAAAGIASYLQDAG